MKKLQRFNQTHFVSRMQNNKTVIITLNKFQDVFEEIVSENSPVFIQDPSLELKDDNFTSDEV